jgi:murein L,D-transpeptidase YcbB/YkuD
MFDITQILSLAFRTITSADKINTVAGKIGPLIPEAIALYNKSQPIIKEVVDLVKVIAPNFIPATQGHVVVPEPMPDGFNLEWVQSALNTAIGSNLTVDGLYGKETHEALMTFQKARGLAVDGWAGPITCAKLFAEVGANPGVAPPAPAPPPKVP